MTTGKDSIKWHTHIDGKISKNIFHLVNAMRFLKGVVHFFILRFVAIDLRCWFKGNGDRCGLIQQTGRYSEIIGTLSVCVARLARDVWSSLVVCLPRWRAVARKRTPAVVIRSFSFLRHESKYSSLVLDRPGNSMWNFSAAIFSLFQLYRDHIADNRVSRLYRL